MRKLASVLIMLLFMTPANADPAGPPNDDGPRIAVARSFMTAFNSSSPTALRVLVPDGALVAAYLKTRREIGELTLKGIVDAGPRQTTVLAFGKNGAVYHVVMWFKLPSVTLLSRVDFEPALAPPVIGASVTELSFVRDLNAYIGSAATHGFYSGTVLVAKAGAPFFSRAYGSASVEYGVANTMQTRFNISSIGKLFTHVAIGQLLQQGKISESDTIGKWLPDYPNQAAKAVTIAQLVDMSSGIGDFFTPKFARTPPGEFRSLEDYLPAFATDPLAFPPGTGNLYSNGGYLVLGLIVQKASGENYYDYVARHIFAPAGMTHSGYPFADDVMRGRATGYSRPAPGEPAHTTIFVEPARGSSAGGAFSTAGDLLNFATALRSGGLLDPRWTKWMLPPGSSFGVAGGTAGWNAFLDMESDTDYTVVVLANIDPPAAEDLGVEIVRWTRHIKP
ncbi:MAG TPA: serine hydrolase domain-containing protein [Candidatus Eremiobacteraceae bacterium]